MYDVARSLSGVEEDIVHPQVFLLFMFLGLFLGAVITFLLSRFAKGLPYTVVVFIVGLLCSIVDQYTEWYTLGLSLHLWQSFPPELILFIFLPALLFGESMTLNPHHANGAAASSILMAGPGALAGMYLTAALCFYALPYGWSWNLCCIVGAILCATDPVAVVALLHRVGASSQLTMVIVLEALMNDGSALVLFNLYLAVLGGDNSVLEPANVAVYFLKVCLISPLLGTALGLGAVGGISIVNRRLKDEDKTIQMAMTLSTAYLSFFIGEYLVHVSGVLTCCMAGFIISLLGKPLILDKEVMHTVWGAIEWIGNTLLFFLAGIIIGNRVILFTHGADFGYIIVVYIYLMLVRAALVIMAYPLLSRWGSKMTIRESVFVTWSGLRGGVCLALVLVLENKAKSGAIDVTESEGHRVAVIVGGVAAITLMVNAVTSASLLRYLGLVKKSTEEQRILLYYVNKRMKKRVRIVLTALLIHLPHINLDTVASFCSVMEGEVLPSQEEIQLLSARPSPRKRQMKYPSDDSLGNSISGSASGVNSSFLRNPYSDIIEDLLYSIRSTFLEVVRNQYWEHIKSGKLPRHSTAASILLYSVDVGLDTVNTPGLQDWDQLSQITDLSVRSRHFSGYSLYERMMGDRAETAVFVLLSFIEAHEEAQHKIPYHLGETEEADTPEEALVVKESRENVSAARLMLSKIPVDMIAFCHSKQAARIVLHSQEELVEDLMTEGIVDEKLASELLKQIQVDYAKLEKAHSFFNNVLRDALNRVFLSYMWNGRGSKLPPIVSSLEPVADGGLSSSSMEEGEEYAIYHQRSHDRVDSYLEEALAGRVSRIPSIERLDLVDEQAVRVSRKSSRNQSEYDLHDV